MADKQPSVKFLTPRGVAVYPKLNKPDTKFKDGGEYRCKLLVGAHEIPDELVEKLTKLRDELVAEKQAELRAKKEGAKAKAIKVLDVFKDETNKETGEATGKVVINAKMGASGVSKKDGKPWVREPKLFDAKGNRFPMDTQIWGGSELKLAVEARAYYMPKDNEVGVAFYLQAAQVLKLVSTGGESAADYGFGAEAGYEAEEDTAVSPTDAAPAAAGDEF